MKLEQTNYDNSETGCCALVNPEVWNNRPLDWKEKPFLRDHVRSFLHIPLNFGSVISRDLAAVEELEAYPEEPLTLTEEVSLWGAEIYVALEKDVPDLPVTKISGKFISQVFEGPYRDAGKWAHTMEESLKERGLPLKKLYYYYATCPKCAKHFGKNQVVLLAQVA